MTRARAFELLGLTPTYSVDQGELKRAHRAAAMKAHPDRGGTDVQMQEVNEARDVLRDGTWEDGLRGVWVDEVVDAGQAFADFLAWKIRQAEREKREREARARTPGGRVHNWKPKVHVREDPEKKAREERARRHADLLKNLGLK